MKLFESGVAPMCFPSSEASSYRYQYTVRPNTSSTLTYVSRDRIEGNQLWPSSRSGVFFPTMLLDLQLRRP